jgi:hypothetical protein
VIAEHSAPILAALTSPPTGMRMFDGPVTANTTPPYFVVYISVVTPEAVGLEASADLVETTARVHSVGASATATRIVADWVYAALAGVRPVVAGRDCQRIRLIDGRPLDVNEETGQRVLNQVDVYRYTSVPG